MAEHRGPFDSQRVIRGHHASKEGYVSGIFQFCLTNLRDSGLNFLVHGLCIFAFLENCRQFSSDLLTLRWREKHQCLDLADAIPLESTLVEGCESVAELLGNFECLVGWSPVTPGGFGYGHDNQLAAFPG